MSAQSFDVAVVGGGINGLSGAAALSRGGLRVVLLERRASFGGSAATEEIQPGWRCPTGRHAFGGLSREVVSRLKLRGAEAFGQVAEPAMVVLGGEAPLVLPARPEAAADRIAPRSQKDAESYLQRSKFLRRVRDVLRPILEMTPPRLEEPALEALWPGVKLAWKARKLGERELYDLLRYGPMCVGDLVTEWFEDRALQAAVASGGVWGTANGPWGAGSAAVLLFRLLSGDSEGLIADGVLPHGGMGAVSAALVEAARGAGVTLRSEAEVSRVVVEKGRCTGVALSDGEVITATRVVSALDPRTSLVKLAGPANMPPELLERALSYRGKGTIATMQICLDGLPSFPSLGEDAAKLLRGRLQIGADVNDIERSFDPWKYGELPERPLLDVVVPSLADPSLCPEGKQVMSVQAAWVPHTLAEGDWDSQREVLGKTILARLGELAPDLVDRVEATQVLAPPDLEARFGIHQGHFDHGELALDQLFVMRPVGGLCDYQSPLEGFWLGGQGTHPGGPSGQSGINAAKRLLETVAAAKG